MSKDLKAGYSELLSQDVPDLWDRIRTDLPEKHVRKQTKRYSFRRLTGIAAACLAAAVIIPLAVMNGSGSKTAASEAAEAPYVYEDNMAAEAAAGGDLFEEAAAADRAAGEPAVPDTVIGAVIEITGTGEGGYFEAAVVKAEEGSYFAEEDTILVRAPYENEFEGFEPYGIAEGTFEAELCPGDDGSFIALKLTAR